MQDWKQRLRARVDDGGWAGAWKQLSKESGLGETFVRDVLQYDKDPSVSNLLKLCARLGISASELLDGTPTPFQRVSVIGRLEGEEWQPTNLGLEAEFHVEGEPIAIEVQDDLIPGYRRGDIIIGVKRPTTNAHSLFGVECIVMTDDDKRHVRYLQRSATRGRFTLRSHWPSEKDVENVKLAWVAPVVWVRRAAR